MSLAENLLNSLETTNVTNSYSASNEEPHIVVGADRNIIVPQSLRKIAVTGDTGVETVTFDCVRYWDGNDLSTFAIYLNYVLPDRSIGTYIPKSITANDGEDAFHFDWEINRYMTKANGTIAFSITAIKTKLNDSGETVVDKQWGSFPNTECSIVEGVDIANVPDNEETADILAQISGILEDIRDSSVSGGSSSDVPSYWLKELQNGSEAINAAVESAGRNKSSFLFYTDAHWGYGSGMSPKLLKYLGKHTAINKTIFGGDFGNTYEYPDTGKTMDEWMDVMRSWKLAVRDIPNHHSVVGNHDKDITAISNDKALYGFLFAPEETNDIVRGGDFFYYIDDNNEKTRYFYLNTGLCNFSDEQCAFLIDGLTSVPSGWHIVAVSHIWFVYDSTSTPTVGSVPPNIQKLLNLLDAYNARTTGSMTIDSEACPYDFSDCEGLVEFCIGGHTHVDFTFTSRNGIPVILCQTDSRHIRGGEYTFTFGTTTEAAVSGIVADYNTNNLHVIRVGRGSSFDVDLVGGTTRYPVTYRLENVESSSTVSSVEEGGSYSTTLTATAGTTIKHVIVEMGGSPITSIYYDESTGVLAIPAVTGAIVITAVAQADTPVEPDEPTGNYTNVLKTSIDKDGNIFNGGKGWADNSRIGSVGIYLGNGTAYVTGHIKIDRTIDNTFYLKNVTFDSTTSDNYKYMVAVFDSSRTRTTFAYGGNAMYPDSDIKNYCEAVIVDNNIVQFTIGASKFASNNEYIAICCSYLGDDSIITINEPIE